MIAIICHEYDRNEHDEITQIMCVRGLCMLMLNDQFADYMGQDAAEKLLTGIREIIEVDVCEEKRDAAVSIQEYVPAVQFLSVLPLKL